MTDSAQAAVRGRDLGKTFTVPVREAGLRAATLCLFRRQTKQVHAVAGITFDIEPGEVRVLGHVPLRRARARRATLGRP